MTTCKYTIDQLLSLRNSPLATLPVDFVHVDVSPMGSSTGPVSQQYGEKTGNGKKQKGQQQAQNDQVEVNQGKKGNKDKEGGKKNKESARDRERQQHRDRDRGGTDAEDQRVMRKIENSLSNIKLDDNMTAGLDDFQKFKLQMMKLEGKQLPKKKTKAELAQDEAQNLETFGSFDDRFGGSKSDLGAFNPGASSAWIGDDLDIEPMPPQTPSDTESNSGALESTLEDDMLTFGGDASTVDAIKQLHVNDKPGKNSPKKAANKKINSINKPLGTGNAEENDMWNAFSSASLGISPSVSQSGIEGFKTGSSGSTRRTSKIASLLDSQQNSALFDPQTSTQHSKASSASRFAHFFDEKTNKPEEAQIQQQRQQQGSQIPQYPPMINKGVPHNINAQNFQRQSSTDIGQSLQSPPISLLANAFQGKSDNQQAPHINVNAQLPPHQIPSSVNTPVSDLSQLLKAINPQTPAVPQQQPQQYPVQNGQQQNMVGPNGTPVPYSQYPPQLGQQQHQQQHQHQPQQHQQPQMMQQHPMGQPPQHPQHPQHPQQGGVQPPQGGNDIARILAMLSKGPEQSQPGQPQQAGYDNNGKHRRGESVQSNNSVGSNQSSQHQGPGYNQNGGNKQRRNNAHNQNNANINGQNGRDSTTQFGNGRRSIADIENEIEEIGHRNSISQAAAARRASNIYQKSNPVSAAVSTTASTVANSPSENILTALIQNSIRSKNLKQQQQQQQQPKTQPIEIEEPNKSVLPPVMDFGADSVPNSAALLGSSVTAAASMSIMASSPSAVNLMGATIPQSPTTSSMGKMPMINNPNGFVESQNGSTSSIGMLDNKIQFQNQNQSFMLPNGIQAPHGMQPMQPMQNFNPMQKQQSQPQMQQLQQIQQMQQMQQIQFMQQQQQQQQHQQHQQHQHQQPQQLQSPNGGFMPGMNGQRPQGTIPPHMLFQQNMQQNMQQNGQMPPNGQLPPHMHPQFQPPHLQQPMYANGMNTGQGFAPNGPQIQGFRPMNNGGIPPGMGHLQPQQQPRQ